MEAFFPTPGAFVVFRDHVYHKYEIHGYRDGLTLEGTAAIVLYLWDFKDPRCNNPRQRLDLECSDRNLTSPCISFYHELRRATQVLPSRQYKKLFRGLACRLVTVSDSYKIGSSMSLLHFISTTTKRDGAKGFTAGEGTLLMFKDFVGVDITRYSIVPEEEEVILVPPHAVIQILDNQHASPQLDSPHDMVLLGRGDVPSPTSHVYNLSDVIPIIASPTDHSQLRVYTRILETSNNPEAWNGIGVAILHDNKMKNGTRVLNGKAYEAKRCFEMALHVAPYCSYYWRHLGYAGGGTVGAVEFTSHQCYEKAVENDLTDGLSWNTLGCDGGGTVQSVHYNEEQCAQRALEADDMSAMAWYLLGVQGGGVCHGVRYSETKCHDRALQLDEKPVVPEAPCGKRTQ
jgi:hypothetical protein